MALEKIRCNLYMDHNHGLTMDLLRRIDMNNMAQFPFAVTDFKNKNISAYKIFRKLVSQGMVTVSGTTIHTLNRELETAGVTDSQRIIILRNLIPDQILDLIVASDEQLRAQKAHRAQKAQVAERKAQRAQRAEDAVKTRRCKNDVTIMGESTKNIPTEKLYVSPAGNCFNVSEDLFQHIMNGNNTDPYTGTPLWVNRSGMLGLLTHNGWTAEERAALHDLLLSPLKPEVIRVISESPLFAELFVVGASLISDYTTDFQVSTSLITQYLEKLTMGGADGKILLNLRERRLGNPETIEQILRGAGSSCIHLVGNRLMQFYLDLWHMTPKSSRPPLPPTVIKSKAPIANDTALVAITVMGGDNKRIILLYIFDQENMAQDSHLDYFIMEDMKFDEANNGHLPPQNPSLIPIWKNAKLEYLEARKKTYAPLIQQAVSASTQLNQRVQDMIPRPIMILQSTYDPNGAFDRDGDRGLLMVFGTLTKFRTEHHYVSSAADIETILLTASETVPIAHLVIMAHGNETSISLSETETIDSDNLGIVADAIKQSLAPKASIFLHSCDVGAVGVRNIAQQLSNYTNRSVWGAEQSVNRGDILVTRIKEHKDHIDITYDIDQDHVAASSREPYHMIKFNPQLIAGVWTPGLKVGSLDLNTDPNQLLFVGPGIIDIVVAVPDINSPNYPNDAVQFQVNMSKWPRGLTIGNFMKYVNSFVDDSFITPLEHGHGSDDPIEISYINGTLRYDTLEHNAGHYILYTK